MKIVHVVAPARVGGLERVVSALAKGQRQNRRDVQLVLLLETGAAEPPLVDQMANAEVPVVRIVEPARAFRAQRRAIRSVCVKLKPDVLHTHGYLPDVLAASLGRKATPARVSTVHGFTGGGLRNRFYEWLQRRSYTYFDAVVAVSRKLGDRLASTSFTRKRFHVVPNAFAPPDATLSRIMARQALRIPEKCFTIGWVGRFSPEKGPDVMVDVLARLRDIDVRLVFIGEGKARPRLERQTRALNLAERVSWHSEITDAGRYFTAFDVFVNSSRTEGTPITLFEAMYSEVPIVATAVGGVPDVISAREATLVPAGNASALAAAVRDVHDHPDAAAARAARAKSRLHENFALGPWLEAYDRIYREALSSRRR